MVLETLLDTQHKNTGSGGGGKGNDGGGGGQPGKGGHGGSGLVLIAYPTT